MSATYVESLTNPRDSLPNVYTNVAAREIDFVSRFGDNWEKLMNIMGIMRPIKKTPGTDDLAVHLSHFFQMPRPDFHTLLKEPFSV